MKIDNKCTTTYPTNYNMMTGESAVKQDSGLASRDTFMFMEGLHFPECTSVTFELPLPAACLGKCV